MCPIWSKGQQPRAAKLGWDAIVLGDTYPGLRYDRRLASNPGATLSSDSGGHPRGSNSSWGGMPISGRHILQMLFLRLVKVWKDLPL